MALPMLNFILRGLKVIKLNQLHFNSLQGFKVLSKLQDDCSIKSPLYSSFSSSPTPPVCQVPKKEDNCNVTDSEYKCLDYFNHSKYFYYDIDRQILPMRLPQPKSGFKEDEDIDYCSSN